MGTEPREEDMPVDYGTLPYEIQFALQIYNLLPSRIAEFSGIYLGKDYGNLSFFFDMYDIDKSWHMFYFRVLLHIDSVNLEISEKKRKAKEAASQKTRGK